MARLGDLIEEYSVRNKLDENIPVYSVTNDRGFCKNYFSKEVASNDRTTYKIVPKGYFAYNPSRINVGSIDWQRCENRVIVSPLYVVFGVLPQLDQQYLLYYLKSDRGQAYIEEFVEGSVRDSLKFSGLSKIPVRLYPVDEQQRFVAILDKLSGLISLRKQQLAKLDELVKARFVEMFGDPILNPKRFQTISGKELFKLSNGKTVPEEKRKTSGIPAYGGNGISWYTDEVLYANDTLVIGRVGFQSGNVHLVKGPLWITDNAMYISEFYSDDTDLSFLYSLMEHIDFTRYQDAGDLRKITQKPFMQMDFIYPPMELQHHYSTFVVQTNKSRLTIQQSLDKLEMLKKTLMQEYFG